MRVFVTGIAGFAGPVVAAALLEAGHEVHGLVRGPTPWPRLAGLPLAPDALHRGDLADGRFPELVRDVAPDAVVHLAGLSFAPAAERDPAGAYRTNLGGTLAVLAAVRAHAPRARVLAVTSSDIYGAVEAAELPVVEETPLRPVTVYGATKAAADIAAAQWGRAYGLDIVRARPFNHTGPGQDPAFVCSALARQLALIEAGRQEPIVRIGNPDPVRDFSDVRDIAAGYVALLERGRSGDAYNLCSGEGVSVAEVIALLRTHARAPVRVHSDPALRRAHDVPRIVGSHAHATEHTGWRPARPLSATLREVLEDWRARVAVGG
ncbi:MAG TPA: GDP-mannose 4,6-dehydratase [Candidatus Limnocylindria bacterium]|jgi:GDP-4-dehydro-6-deoxy-D-mannose reductase|nr:GDP-mannose 4,6-dehydratase [Candidatus Limnocylindria bacterium]